MKQNTENQTGDGSNLHPIEEFLSWNQEWGNQDGNWQASFPASANKLSQVENSFTQKLVENNYRQLKITKAIFKNKKEQHEDLVIAQYLGDGQLIVPVYRFDQIGTDLFIQRRDYWIKITKYTPLERFIRALLMVVCVYPGFVFIVTLALAWEQFLIVKTGRKVNFGHGSIEGNKKHSLPLFLWEFITAC